MVAGNPMDECGGYGSHGARGNAPTADDTGPGKISVRTVAFPTATTAQADHQDPTKTSLSLLLWDYQQH